MPQTVPLHISPEANSRVEQLGLRGELDRMIEHGLQTASGLRAVRVTLEDDPINPSGEPRVVVWLHRDVPQEGAAEDRTNTELWRWVTHTFPPAVLAHFEIGSVYGGPDGR
jgi:hypothetical protein